MTSIQQQPKKIPKKVATRIENKNKVSNHAKLTICTMLECAIKHWYK